MKTVDAILRLKSPDVIPTLTALAQFSLEEFGAGGNPEATKEEDFLGWVSSQVKGGYIRVRVSIVYGQALEYIKANGGHPLCELELVLWPTDADGEPIIYEPFMVEVDDTNLDGVVIGKKLVELGGF